MEPKLLLVKAITLLYRESQLDNSADGSADLVKQVIESIKIPENIMEGDRSREIIVGLRQTAMWMANNPQNYDYDKNMLLQRIRVNTGYETGLYEAFEAGLYEVDTDEEIKKICLDYREVLRNYLHRDQVKDIVKKVSQKVMFQEESIDWKNFVGDTIAELEPYAAAAAVEGRQESMDAIDFDDTGAMARMFERAADEVSNQGTIKFGWHALNRITGEHNGGRRGEFWVVQALQHNFKTGFTLSLFKHAALYNKPHMRDPEKKPLLIHLSLENNLTDNLIWLYVNLKENETGEACDINNTGVSRDEMAEYVRERMMVNGYHIRMYRENPSEFGYHDFFDRISHLESQGFEIHMVVCDYLNMMTKKGCVSSGPSGDDIRDLFRRIRNYTAPRGILFITPHQLSTEAKALDRQGVDNFAQEVAGKGYYDGCKRIDQEVDFELVIHIEKRGNESYLTMQRGKHRKVRVTPQQDLYSVLKFQPVGTIPDDLNKEDTSMKKVGGASLGGDGGDAEWWASV